jgi:hypothetical protein
MLDVTNVPWLAFNPFFAVKEGENDGVLEVALESRPNDVGARRK